MKRTERTDVFQSYIFVYFYAQDTDCEQGEEKNHILTERRKQKVPQKSGMLLSGYSIPGTYSRVTLFNKILSKLHVPLPSLEFVAVPLNRKEDQEVNVSA